MMIKAKEYNILFVVCHPDDEAFWVGGMIASFSKFPFIKAHVICLSGKDTNSPREKEFFEARKIAGYDKGIVTGFKLRPALTPLPDTSATVVNALKEIGLEVNSIDLLITHGPFGDEQKHPHHVQTYRELLAWSSANRVPFGFFSCLPIDFIYHRSLLKNCKRHNELHLLSLARCQRSISSKLLTGLQPFKCPRYYVQFLTDGAIKTKMLECYTSVDVPGHKKTYSMFTNNVEAIYVDDDRGMMPIKAIVDAMEIPGADDLFEHFTVKAKIKRKLNKIKNKLFEGG